MFLALVVEHMLEVEDTGHNVSSGLDLHKLELRAGGTTDCHPVNGDRVRGALDGGVPGDVDIVQVASPHQHVQTPCTMLITRADLCLRRTDLRSAGSLWLWTAVTGAGSGGGDSLNTDLDHGGNTGLKLQILYVEQTRHSNH